MGVWIETEHLRYEVQAACSHTLRGCVDWNTNDPTALEHVICHTLRGCVDWNTNWGIVDKLPPRVTPFVGVWIETRYRCFCSKHTESHTLRGCVDWNWELIISTASSGGHTLRGCVDWNIALSNIVRSQHSHTLRGCVDWNGYPQATWAH